jgi:hypothetical protein
MGKKVKGEQNKGQKEGKGSICGTYVFMVEVEDKKVGRAIKSM